MPPAEHDKAMDTTADTNGKSKDANNNNDNDKNNGDAEEETAEINEEELVSKPKLCLCVCVCVCVCACACVVREPSFDFFFCMICVVLSLRQTVSSRQNWRAFWIAWR